MDPDPNKPQAFGWCAQVVYTMGVAVRCTSAAGRRCGYSWKILESNGFFWMDAMGMRVRPGYRVILWVLRDFLPVSVLHFLHIVPQTHTFHSRTHSCILTLTHSHVFTRTCTAAHPTERSHLGS